MSRMWVVTEHHERTYGPYSDEQMFTLIDQMVFVGEEEVAEYPGGSWHPISHHPEFYDRIVDRLASSDVMPSKERRLHLLEQVKKKTGFQSGEKPTAKNNFTVDEKTELVRSATNTGSSKGKAILEKVEPSKEPASHTQTHKVSSATPVQQPKTNVYNSAHAAFGNAEKAIVELKKKSSGTKKKKQNSQMFKFIIGAVAIVAVGIILMPDEKRGGGDGDQKKIHLVLPRWKTTEGQDVAVFKPEILRQIVAGFEKDTFTTYLKAQNDLVKLVEQNSTQAQIYSMLCLTYRELWPFSYADAQDLSVVSQVAQKASVIDPIGIHGATCRVVQQLLTGREDSAKGMIDTVLAANSQAVVFYEMKSQILWQNNDVVTALSYMQKASQLWPNWLKTSVQEARLQEANNNFNESANLLKKVLKLNPGHAPAKIYFGALELLRFGHLDTAQELFTTGLNESSKLTTEQQARAYYYLAMIHERQGRVAKALELAKKAFALSSSNREIRDFLVRVGGSDVVNAVQSSDQELLATGENYLKAGNCFAAQAQFKAAFELNPKNAQAALKAGQCLWQIHRGNEAIDWVKKAAVLDPKLVSAHTQLSYYYAQRFDFAQAMTVLNTIASRVKENYEIYRAFAQLELLRNNYQGSITFSKRALKLYDSDLESHLVLVKADMAMNDMREAYQYAARAIEIDANSRAAQALYAEVLAAFQGVKAGQDYAMNLINTYPTITEYRVALAKIYKREERYPESEAMAKQVTEIEAENKEAFTLLGDVLFAQRKYQDALKAYLTAATIDPSDAVPLAAIAAVHLANNNPSMAMQQYNRVLQLNENFPRAYYNIGRAALLMGDAQKALLMAQKEQKMNPNIADAYLLAADSYVEMRQYSKAIGEYQRAVKLRPSGAALYVQMAKAYRLAGNTEAAVSMLNLAATKESGYAEIYKELGATHEQKGSNVEAVEAYSQYLRLVPNAPDREKIQTRIRNLGG